MAMNENQDPPKNAKIAVVGGRDFSDYEYMKHILDAYHTKHGISWIVSGGAPGADKMAERYAKDTQIFGFSVYIAQWNKYGTRAGSRRNLLIAETCDALIAFPTPSSKGTWNAVKLARKLGKPVYVMQGCK